MILFWTTAFCWALGAYIYSLSVGPLGREDSSMTKDSSTYNRPSLHPPTKNSQDRLFYFIQISDLHVSRYSKRGGLLHLNAFLSKELPFISPELVVVTGDLTDAKSFWKLSSLQHEEEWIDYRNALEKSKVLDRHGAKFWLDQRGNHDCFDVASFHHPSNHYKLYSSVGKEGFLHQIKKSYGTYSFVSVDACPKYGTRRPMNFFGYLDESDMDFLQEGLRKPSNHSFVLSHYPSGTVIKGFTSRGASFSQVTQNASIWLSGHLHRLFAGLGHTMYSIVPGRFLELELGDMKDNAMFRILAIDHDSISFIDQPLHLSQIPKKVPKKGIPSTENEEPGRPPIILITQPKDGRFRISHKEPQYAVSQLSQIRFLLWTYAEPTQFNISIDGVSVPGLIPKYIGKGKPWVEKETYLPLWTVDWVPPIDDQIHTLEIQVTDASGERGSHSVQFKSDGDLIRNLKTGSGGFIISLDFPKLFQSWFLCVYFLFTTFGLLIPKWTVYKLKKSGRYSSWRTAMSQKIIQSDLANLRTPLDLLWRSSARWFLRLCELSRISNIFLPYYAYLMFIVTMPWFIGEFVPSGPKIVHRWGFYFVYGIFFTDGTWIPLLDTWAYAAYALTWSVIPIYLYLSCYYTPAYLLYSSKNPRRLRPLHKKWYVTGLILIWWLYASSDVIFFIFYYGSVSSLFNPGRTWFLLWLGYQVLTVWWHQPHSSRKVSRQDAEDKDAASKLLSDKQPNSSGYHLRSRGLSIFAS